MELILNTDREAVVPCLKIIISQNNLTYLRIRNGLGLLVRILNLQVER